MLTFTRRAAREMLTRTRALLERAGVAAQGSVVGGTFHSVAWRLVRLYAEPLGLPPRLSVLDASDSADLLDVVRQELGYAESGRRFPRKGTLADIYSRTVNAQRPLSEVLVEQFPWCEPYTEEIGRIFTRFGQRKREAQALDLDDLLLYARALAAHETAGRKLAAMFEHVLVDEYQDVDALQVDLVRELRRENRGLSVVGDDLQAIYGFRAASAGHAEMHQYGQDRPELALRSTNARRDQVRGWHDHSLACCRRWSTAGARAGWPWRRACL